MIIRVILIFFFLIRMDQYDYMNKSGPVRESFGKRTTVSKDDDGSILFDLEAPVFGTVLSLFGFSDTWHGMESEIYLVQDQLILLLSTTDSRGFAVCTPVVLDYPVFLSLYKRVNCEGAKERMRQMDHKLIPYLDKFLRVFSDLDLERIILAYLTVYDEFTIKTFKEFMNSLDIDEPWYTQKIQLTLNSIHVQSGEVSSRQRSRLRRDLIQRERAYAEAQEKKKKVPKRKRKAQVKKARADKRTSQVLEDFGDINLEGGFGAIANVLKTIAMMPIDLYRTCQRTAEIVQRMHSAMDKVEEIIDDDGTRRVALGVGATVLDAVRSADERSADVVSAVQGVARAHRSVTEEIQRAIQNLTQALSKDLPDLIVKTLVGALFVYLFTSFNSTAMKLAIMSLAGIYFSQDIYNLFAKAFRLGKEAVQEEEQVNEEGGGDTFFAQVMALIMAGSIFAGGKPPGYTGLLVKMVQAITSIPRLGKGIESVTETTMAMIEAVVNTVRSWMKKNPVRLFKKHADSIEKLITEAIDFEYTLMCGNHGLSDAGIFNKISHFVESFSHHRKTISHDDKLKKELDYFIVRFQRHADPYKVSVSANGGYRAQPVTLVLAGDPGIGKTMCTQTLCLTLMKLTGHIGKDVSVEEASRSVFVKPANSKYLDGYTTNYAYLIDDLFQEKPVPGTEGSEAADIMTYHGSFNASLNMADCPKKGMYPFTSKLILATTNCRNFSQIGLDKILLDVNAFQRRLDFHVLVQVKPQFRLPDSHMLDPTLFAVEAANGRSGINSYPWHIWEWVPTSFVSGGCQGFVPGTGRCMRSLLTQVAQKITTNEQLHQTTMNMFESIVRGDADEWIPEESGNVNFDLLRQMTQDEEEITSFAPSLSSIDEEDEPSDEVLDELHETLENDQQLQDYIRRRTTGETTEILSEDKVKLLVSLSERKNRVVDLVKKHFSFTWTGTRKLIAFGVASVVVTTWALELIKGTYRWIRNFFMGEKVVEQSNGPKVRTAHCFKQEVINTENGGVEVPGLWYNVYKNSFKAFMDHGDNMYTTMGQVLVLKGDTFVMPRHFLRQIQTQLSCKTITLNSEIVFRSCALQEHNMTIKVGQFLRLRWHHEEDRDLAFSSFGPMCPPKKDITKFILSARQIKDLGGRCSRMDTARASIGGQLLKFSERVSYFSESLVIGRQPKYIGQFPDGTNHKHWLSYRADTMPGDCGAIISVTDFSALQNRFVCGLHIGRRDQSTEAYATQLDIETVSRALEKLNTPEVIPEIPLEQVAEECGWTAVGATAVPLDTMPFNDGESDCFGSFTPVCTVSPGIVSPIQSSLVKTQLGREVFFEEQIKEISGVEVVPELEVMKMHSYLNEDGKVVLPMAEALKPFAGDTKYVDPEKFKTAVYAAMYPFSQATRDHMARKLTFEEAVLGCPEIGLASIPRSTSLGYPWCTKKRDKTYFFGKGEEYDITTPEAQQLKKEVLDLEKLLLAGKRPLFLCRDFLKDEVRKKGKGARLIAGTDVRYYILCRMYFGAYTAAIMSTHQKTGMCLGVNQYAEWGWLRRFILRHGNRVWDGDFARFDSTQQPTCLWVICHFINSWYAMRGGTPEDSAVRKILFMDLVNSRHLVSLKGAATGVVEWAKSLPSGHFLTAPVNTTYGMACISGGCIALTGHMDTWNYIAVAEQGDDNLVGASDSVTDRFNQVTLAKFLWDEYGMVYTAGRKGEELKPYMDIEEVTFLQRRFAKKEGVDVCPIRPESFLHSLYYTKKNKEEHVKRFDMIAGLERALEELSMHEEKHWAPTAARIVEAMRHYNHVPVLDTETSRDYMRAVLSRVPDYV